MNKIVIIETIVVSLAWIGIIAWLFRPKAKKWYDHCSLIVIRNEEKRKKQVAKEGYFKKNSQFNRRESKLKSDVLKV